MNDEIYKYFNIPYMDKDGIIRYASGHVSKRLIESTDDWYRIALQVWRRDIDRFKALEGEIGSAEPVKTVALEGEQK